MLILPSFKIKTLRCQIPIVRYVCFHRRHDADFEVPNEALGSDLNCLWLHGSLDNFAFELVLVGLDRLDRMYDHKGQSHEAFVVSSSIWNIRSQFQIGTKFPQPFSWILQIGPKPHCKAQDFVLHPFWIISSRFGRFTNYFLTRLGLTKIYDSPIIFQPDLVWRNFCAKV